MRTFIAFLSIAAFDWFTNWLELLTKINYEIGEYKTLMMILSFTIIICLIQDFKEIIN
jgi:hypothetical protein